MSSRNLARRTKAEVSFGGIDITKSIQPYLLSISYTDNEEDETDDLQIKIQDRDDLWRQRVWRCCCQRSKQIPRYTVCLGRQQSERL